MIARVVLASDLPGSAVGLRVIVTSYAVPSANVVEVVNTRCPSRRHEPPARSVGFAPVTKYTSPNRWARA